MPKRSARKAPTRMTTAWTKRERRTLMPASFESQQEGDEVHVLLRRQGLAEDRWHDAFRVARHGAHRRGVQDLAQDVLGVWIRAICDRSGPTCAAPTLPAL